MKSHGPLTPTDLLPPEELCGCGLALHYTSPDVQVEVSSLAVAYGLCVRVQTDHGVFFFPRHFLALHPATASELGPAAEEHGFAKVEFCPHCGHDLTAYDESGKPKMVPETFPPHFYSTKIGMEIPGVYDGILFWVCPVCNGRWHRFSENDDRYEAADEYVNGDKG